MLIRLHVYDDGDTELKRVGEIALMDSDFHYNEDSEGEMADLRDELDSYGHERPRIETAITEVLDSQPGTEIIV